MATKFKHAHAIRGGSQEGSTSLEFAFSLMPVVFALMFFMGMGYTIGSKQHSVMAARYTTTAYVASRNGSTYTKPSDSDVANAAFNGVEQWQTAERSHQDMDANIDQSGVASGVLGVFNGIMNALNLNRVAGYEASTQPNRGLIANLYTVQRAKSQYFLVKGTWTCKEMGGSGYLSWALSQVPLLNQLNSSCCETYDNR